MTMDEIVRDLARRIALRDEVHVRAELARLGIAPEDAPGRVVILYPSPSLPIEIGAPPPLPEVITVAEARRRGFGVMVDPPRLPPFDVAPFASTTVYVSDHLAPGSKVPLPDGRGFVVSRDVYDAIREACRGV